MLSFLKLYAYKIKSYVFFIVSSFFRWGTFLYLWNQGNDAYLISWFQEWYWSFAAWKVYGSQIVERKGEWFILLSSMFTGNRRTYGNASDMEGMDLEAFDRPNVALRSTVKTWTLILAVNSFLPNAISSYGVAVPSPLIPKWAQLVCTPEAYRIDPGRFSDRTIVTSNHSKRLRPPADQFTLTCLLALNPTTAKWGRYSYYPYCKDLEKDLKVYPSSRRWS